MDNEEFIYFLHPEYNKEAVRGEGRGSEFECVCVCVCVCVWCVCVFSRYLLVCVRSIAWQPKTEVRTYVSACVQHNRLCAHMMGLTFKMYCNDNVEDDTYSNCIDGGGIEISLSRALHPPFHMAL